MYTYAKFDQTIPSGYKVRSNQQRQNHRQRMTAAEATGGLDALLRQICALDSAGFLLKHKRVKLEQRNSNLCKTLSQRNKLSMIW